MNRIKYASFLKIEAVLVSMSTAIWMSLTSFSIMSKSSVGIENIPVFELIMSLTALLGVKLAHSKINNVSLSIIFDIIIESMFLILLLIVLLICDKNVMVYSGFLIYFVIIVNMITRSMRNEAMRSYEQRNFSKAGSAKFLKLLRNRTNSYNIIGGAVGSIIAVIMLTIFKVNIIEFATYIITCNILLNMYDYHVWFIYLKK